MQTTQPERRRHERFTVPTVLEIQDLPYRQRVGTTDISASGCQVRLQHPLAPGADVEVQVEVQGAGVARGTARIAWESLSDRCHVGLIFDPGLSEAMLPILRKLVM
jgi:hypothetical protein